MAWSAEPNGRGRRIARVKVILGIVALLGSVSTAAAHNGELPPRPPEPPKRTAVPRIIHIKPLRWSWLHWWEANRDLYLQTVRQDRPGQKPDQKQLDRLRRQAVEALTTGLEDELQVRIAAALALGRMREGTVAGKLLQLARSDPAEPVRVAALAALGLIDSKPSEALLMDFEPRTEKQLVARTAGLGLLKSPDAATLDDVQRTLDSRSVAAATTAVWALQHQAGEDTIRLLYRLLERTTSPWLASNAILAIGQAEQPKSIPLLRAILLDTDQARQLPVLAELHERHEERLVAVQQAKLNYERAYRRYAAAHERHRQNNPNAGPTDKRKAPARRGRLIVGYELIYIARLRGAAAIALGGIDHPEARDALLAFLAEKDDDYNALPKGLAIMSLGQGGWPEALPTLIDLVHHRNLKGYRRSPMLESPHRGYAALALGIYARPARSPQGNEDRPGFDKAIEALAGRVLDDRDSLEVRCPAALGLGLSGRTANLPILHEAGSRLHAQRHQSLIGYTMLGRGMLGDVNILPPAQRFLAARNEDTTMSGILGRRAAVLGLGVLGRPSSIPILTNAWHLNYYVNREVALALALCGAENVAEPLIAALKESDDPAEREFMALCLGELFTPERPPRMARFIIGSNYAMKNVQHDWFKRKANDFLFRYLIPAAGRQWF